MIKREANAQVIWGRYISANPTFYGNFELKQSQTDTIPWQRWSKGSDAHQLEELVSAEQVGYYWKHSDIDPRQKPFDCANHKPSPSFLVIWWNLHKKFTVIRIGDFLAEKIHSTEKSLSYTKACEIAERIVKV